jgi:hypothetical protein
MLYLRDFYNINFLNQTFIIYSLRVSPPSKENSGFAPDYDYGFLGCDIV